MKKLKIKTGDNVIVIAGDSKGITGKVLSVDISKNRAIVEGVNMITKHQKPSANNPKGGIVKREASIDISNLSLIDPKTKSATRIGYEMQDGKKVRISKKSKEII